MRFTCERCGKKYATAATPVAGKVYRIKCKACGHLIQVHAAGSASADRPMEPAPADAAAPAPTSPDLFTAAVGAEPSVPANGAPGDAPQMPGEAVSQIALVEPSPPAAWDLESTPRPPSADGYVDMFADSSQERDVGAGKKAQDPFVSAAMASLPDGYGSAGGAPDPFAAERDPAAESPSRPIAIPKIPEIPRPPPAQKSGLPIALIGAGMAVLVGILAFVLLGSGKPAPAPAPRQSPVVETAAPAASTAVAQPEAPPPAAAIPAVAAVPAPAAPAPAAAQPPPEPPKPSAAELRRQEEQRRREEAAQAARDAKDRDRRAKEARDAKDRDRRQKEVAEKERSQREAADRRQREAAERDRAQREVADKERSQKDFADSERRERERLAAVERDRREREKFAIAAAAEQEAESHLSDAQIESVVRSAKRSFDSCLDASRGKDARLDGRTVVLGLNIQPTGTVTYPTLDDVTLNTAELGACLKSAARRMVFPKFKGEPMHAEIPVVLR